MTRLATLLALLGLVLGAPAIAGAHKGSKKHNRSHNKAKVYKAALEPVGTDAAYAGIEGRAHLVDTRKRDTISIHMKGLTRGTTYPWHIHEAAAGVTDPCAEGATQGPIVTAFKYRPLRARGRRGTANSFGRARSFTVDRTKTYYVNVHDPASGAPIACGVLKKKRAHKPKRAHAKKPGIHKPPKPGVHRPKADRNGSGKTRRKGRDDHR